MVPGNIHIRIRDGPTDIRLFSISQRLVINDITLFRHDVVMAETVQQGLKEVRREPAPALLRLSVVRSQDPLDALRGLYQVIVRDLGEDVVDHVGADVVVDVVENAVISVDRRETAPEVAPLLASVPWDARSLGGPVMVQVGYGGYPSGEH